VPDTAFISIGIQSAMHPKIGTYLIIDDLDFAGRVVEEGKK
jgi:hypothetical protein